MIFSPAELARLRALFAAAGVRPDEIEPGQDGDFLVTASARQRVTAWLEHPENRREGRDLAFACRRRETLRTVAGTDIEPPPHAGPPGVLTAWLMGFGLDGATSPALSNDNSRLPRAVGFSLSSSFTMGCAPSAQRWERTDESP